MFGECLSLLSAVERNKQSWDIKKQYSFVRAVVFLSPSLHQWKFHAMANRAELDELFWVSANSPRELKGHDEYGPGDA